MIALETFVSILIVAQAPLLEDVTSSAKLMFTHRTGAEGRFYFPEITGSGVAMFDWDEDGDLDLYLVQSGHINERVRGLEDQVFLNNSSTKTFNSVSIPGTTGYGMGIATVDVNNDGRTDFYLTNVGKNQLWVNEGDGRFRHETESGAEGHSWSTSATFFDYDGDGWMDLYVANYVDFSLVDNPRCYSSTTRQDYCGPSTFAGQSDRVYRNMGHGRFSEVTKMVLADHESGAGLGVVARDFNLDGYPDVFVANDGGRNHLWLNDGRGQFVDQGLFSGVAVNGRGVAEASMGVAVGDYNQDGLQDIFLTHLMGETNTLYENMGDLQFRDVTQKAGLSSVSRRYTGWGTAWVDVNQDGALDLLSINGAVSVEESQRRTGADFPFGQANQIFLQASSGRFEPLAGPLPESYGAPLSGRGAAVGDFDSDGAVDLLISNNNSQAQLFRGRKPTGQWLGLDIRLSNGAAAIGARVEVQFQSAIRQHYVVHRDGSYASSNDPRITIHAPQQKVARVLVIWPSGKTSVFEGLSMSRYHRLKQPQ